MRRRKPGRQALSRIFLVCNLGRLLEPGRRRGTARFGARSCLAHSHQHCLCHRSVLFGLRERAGIDQGDLTWGQRTLRLPFSIVYRSLNGVATLIGAIALAICFRLFNPVSPFTPERVDNVDVLLDRLTLAAGASTRFEPSAKSLAWLHLCWRARRSSSTNTGKDCRIPIPLSCRRDFLPQYRPPMARRCSTSKSPMPDASI